MKRGIRTHATPLSAQAVNVFLDMESGNHNDLVTSTILGNGTHGSGGTWTVTPSPVSVLKVSTAFDGVALLRSVSISGTPYTGEGGTRSFVYTHTTDDEFAKYTVTTNSQRMSLGFWHKTDLHNGDNQARQIDLAYIEGTGVSAVLQFVDATGSANDGLRAHGSSSTTGSTFGTTIPTVANTVYWVTLQYDSLNGFARVAAYNTSGAQVGITSLAAIDTGVNATSMRFGGDSHNTLPSKTSYFDHLVLDWTNAAFPLGV